MDFSEASEVAFTRARDIARRYGAEVRALYVWEVPKQLQREAASWTSATDPPKAASEAVDETARESMEKFLGSAKDDAQVTAQIECGHPATVIAQLAERDGFDLIVMSTHGRSGFRRFVLGSVAEAVMRNANCPVLVVPTGAT